MTPLKAIVPLKPEEEVVTNNIQNMATELRNINRNVAPSSWDDDGDYFDYLVMKELKKEEEQKRR